MKFSRTSPLAWTDGSGRRQMAVLSVEGRGMVRCESTTMGTEILKRWQAEQFVECILENGGHFLPSKRKLSTKKILSILR
jgi:hypothetical protein